MISPPADRGGTVDGGRPPVVRATWIFGRMPSNLRRYPLRHRVRELIFWFLVRARIAHLFRYFNKDNVLIILYHGVVGDRNPHGYHYPSESEFRWQLDFILSHYNLMPLSEVAARLRAGKRLPPYSACLTFDDGLANNYTRVLPALRARGACATVFLPTGHIDSGALLWPEELFLLLLETDARWLDLNEHGLGCFALASPEERHRAFWHLSPRLRELPVDAIERVMRTVRATLRCDPRASAASADYGMLNWREVEEMQASGVFELGAHTVRHENLTRVPVEAARREIAQSVDALVTRFELASVGFAYPYGAFDERGRGLLREQGVAWAVSTIEGLHRPDDDLWSMKRIPVLAHMSRDYFVLSTSGFLETAKALLGRS